MSSRFVREALDRRAEVRAEYELVLLAAYEAAETACNGRLLNRRGMEAGIDPWRLFQSNPTYARAYASEELLEHWEEHARPTFARYEEQRYHQEVDAA